MTLAYGGGERVGNERWRFGAFCGSGSEVYEGTRARSVGRASVCECFDELRLIMLLDG